MMCISGKERMRSLAWINSRSDDDYDAAVDNFRMGRAAMDSVSADCSKASDLFAGS